MYRYVNYVNEYGRIMQFNKNKDICIHRWYPFVEGYSKEFIEAIVNEQPQKVILLGTVFRQWHNCFGIIYKGNKLYIV